MNFSNPASRSRCRSSAQRETTQTTTTDDNDDDSPRWRSPTTPTFAPRRPPAARGTPTPPPTRLPRERSPKAFSSSPPTTTMRNSFSWGLSRLYRNRHCRPSLSLASFFATTKVKNEDAEDGLKVHPEDALPKRRRATVKESEGVRARSRQPTQHKAKALFCVMDFFCFFF